MNAAKYPNSAKDWSRPGVDLQFVAGRSVDQTETGSKPDGSCTPEESEGESYDYSDHDITADSSPVCTSIVPDGTKPILR